MAMQIATRVNVRFCRDAGRHERRDERDSADTMLGCAYVSGEFPWQRDEAFGVSVKRSAYAAAGALVGDMVERGVYWEQWAINERPRRPWSAHRTARRYKCWVLMAAPREKLDERVRVAQELALRRATLDLVKAKEDMKVRLKRQHRRSQLAVMDRVYREEAARHEAAKPETLFDVVDDHRHGQASTKNYTVHDAKELLDAAKVRFAVDEEFTSADVQKMLASGRRYHDVYDLLKFQKQDIEAAQALVVGSDEPKGLAEAADRLMQIYEELNATKKDIEPRPKLPETKLVP
jgi:hypothetical protein